MPMRFLLLLAAGGLLDAQQAVAPTSEPVGPARGDNLGNYNLTQSFELGYRFKQVGGDEGMYRQVVDIGNGLRLLGSSLRVNSRDGHGRYFDEILLNTLGLGNDNYQSAVLRIRKNRLYQYDLNWRLNAWFNPGLTVSGLTAGGFSGAAHLEDTTRRLQDHDLTLFPESRFRLRAGYSRNSEDGPALSTAEEFDSNGAAYPVFTDVRRSWNEYRLGTDIDYAGFRFTFLHRWDDFKDDSPFTSAGVFSSASANDQTVLQSFRRSSPVHGSSPGWFGNLFTRRKLWGMNARLSYVSGARDFALVESACGISQFGGAGNRQVVVGGNARRPNLAGDLSLSLFPGERLTVVNNTSVVSNRIDGQSSYSEASTLAPLSTTIFFRYLGIRLITNSTDLNYRASSLLGFYAGYHYSDRLVRTIEGTLLPRFDTAFNNSLYEAGNQLKSVTAGVRLRPVKPLTVNLDGELGRASNPLTPIAGRHFHAVNGRAGWRARGLQLSAAYRQVYNLNAPFSLQSYSSHSRAWSANASYSARSWITLDAAYNHLHLDSLSSLAFFAGTGSRGQLQTAYPSLYVSNVHAGSLGVRFAVARRADLFVGYSITLDTGDGRSTAVPAGTSDPVRALLGAVQTYPLTYQSPLARVSVKITPKLRWNAGWQFYGYGEDFRLFGSYQNFHAHTGFTSVLWMF